MLQKHRSKKNSISHKKWFCNERPRAPSVTAVIRTWVWFNPGQITCLAKPQFSLLQHRNNVCLFLVYSKPSININSHGWYYCDHDYYKFTDNYITKQN